MPSSNGLPWRYRALLALLPAHVREHHEHELREMLVADAPSMRAMVGDVTRASLAAHSDVLRQDLTQAMRQFRRAPMFALVAGLTLALGIGGNVAFFAFVDGVLLRQLTYVGADRIVDITEENLGRGQRTFGIAPATFRDATHDSTLFIASTLYHGRSTAVRIGQTPERVSSAAVSGEFFRVFVDAPLIGRTLQPEDDVPGSKAIVLSHAFWSSAFGRDPSVVGRELDVDGTAMRVVGVMPSTFTFPTASVAFWRAMGLTPDELAQRGARCCQGAARLRQGVTIESAAAAVAGTGRRLAEQFPRTNTGWTLLTRELRASRVDTVRRGLLFVWGAGALVLLIAIANAASLFLTRAVARQRELAVRVALGAAMGRVLRQLITEATVLALASAAVGLVIAHVLLEQLRPLASDFVPRIAEVAVDRRAVAYATLLALVTTGILSAFAAGWGRARHLWAVLGTTRSSGSRRRRAIQRVIVAGEVAIAAFVLVAGAIVTRTLILVLSQPMGFDERQVQVFRIEPPWRANVSGPTAAAVHAITLDRTRAVMSYDALLARLRALPGVQAVGAVNRLPLTGDWWTSGVRLPERASDGPESRIPVYVRPVTPGYFAAMGTRVVRGRDISDADRADGQHVIVVDAEFARSAWGDLDPIGREVLTDGPPGAPPPRVRVVGVVESIHMSRLDAERRPTMYVPLAQSGEGFYLNWGMDVVLRAAAPIPDRDLRQIAGDVFPDAAVFRIASMTDIVARSTADRRFQLVVIGLFGILALVLTTVGVAGTLLLSVRERREELAVRLALGAAPSQLWWSVQRDGLLLSARGVVIGLGAAWAGARVFQSVAFGVSPRDPLSLAGATVLVLVASFVAIAIPATRAMRIDPARAMRE